MKNRLEKLNQNASVSLHGGTAVLKKGAFENVQGVNIFRPLASFLKTSLETIKIWENRSQERQNLLGLDEYLLEDIGLTPYEVKQEAKKWFWQA